MATHPLLRLENLIPLALSATAVAFVWSQRRSTPASNAPDDSTPAGGGRAPVRALWCKGTCKLLADRVDTAAVVAAPPTYARVRVLETRPDGWSQVAYPAGTLPASGTLPAGRTPLSAKVGWVRTDKLSETRPTMLFWRG